MVERKKTKAEEGRLRKETKTIFGKFVERLLCFFRGMFPFLGGGGATWFETFGYLVKTVNGHSRLVHHGKKDGTFGY